MREHLASGEIPFRKACLGSRVDRIKADDRKIRVIGRKDVQEHAIIANGALTPGVRSFVRKWRARKDSNL